MKAVRIAMIASGIVSLAGCDMSMGGGGVPSLVSSPAATSGGTADATGAAQGAPAAAPPAQAEVLATAEANYSQVRLPIGFASGVAVEGTVGTGVNVRTLANAPRTCRGRIAERPDHVVLLDSAYDQLTLQAQVGRGSLLVVRGPDGVVRCESGDAPAITDAFAAGRYEVWVGGPRRASNGAAYQLSLNATPPAATPQPAAQPVQVVQPQPMQPQPVQPQPVQQQPVQQQIVVHHVVQQQPVYVQQPQAQPVYQQPTYVAPQAQPAQDSSNFGSTRLSTGFMPDPQQMSGTSGGSVAASSIGQNCQGFVASRPDHILYLDTAFAYLRIETASQSDTTLLIRGAGQIWCDDDTAGGTNARIHGPFQAGRYEVYIGSYRSGDYSPYTLSMTEFQPQQAAQQPQYVQQQPQGPVAVDEYRYQELLAYYNGVTYSGDQPPAAQGLVNAGNWFTAQQIVGFVNATSYSQTQVDVAVILWQHVVDPENEHRVAQAFTYSGSADEFRRRIH